MPHATASVETFNVSEVELTAEQFGEALAAETKRRTGMSVEEMLARYDRGDLPDADRLQDLLIAARLLIEPAAA